MGLAPSFVVLNSFQFRLTGRYEANNLVSDYITKKVLSCQVVER